MNQLVNVNTSFVELEENVLEEINGGFPWKTAGKLAWKGLKYVGGAVVDTIIDGGEPAY